MRDLALLALLALSGCGASPALIGAGLGVLAGELKLGTAVVELITANRARPPDCAPTVPPPCVLLPPSPSSPPASPPNPGPKP